MSTGRVGFGLSRTVNMGDFNSVRFEVNVELPCDHSPEGLESGFRAAVDFVTPKMLTIFSAVATRQHAIAVDPQFAGAMPPSAPVFAAPPPPAAPPPVYGGPSLPPPPPPSTV